MMKQKTVSFKLASQHVVFLVTLVALSNLLVLAGTWLYNLGNWADNTRTQLLFVQLSLAHENVLATWYSSMLLLLAAIFFAVCFVADQSRFYTLFGRFLNLGWVMFSLIFITLSFDEIGSFHENIGDTSAFNAIENFSGWFLFYFLLVFTAFLMLAFAWMRLRHTPSALAFMVIGVFLFLSIPLQEVFEINSWRSSLDPDSWRRPVLYIILEEGSEIFGTFCFLISGLIYSSHATDSGRRNRVLGDINLEFILSNSRLLLYNLLLIGSIGVVMGAMPYITENTTRGDEGIPENWFPCAVSFLCALYCLYGITRYKHTSHVYYGLAALSLVMSMYYGANMYGYTIAGKPGKVEIMFFVAVFAAVLYTGYKLVMELKSLPSQIGVIASMAVLCIAISIGKSFSAELAFTAFSLLYITLSAHIFQQQAFENAPVPLQVDVTALTNG